MSQISRLKKSAFIVIDETGYNEDDSSHEEEESSYEFLYRSNKMKTRTKTRDTKSDQVPIIDIDEPNTEKDSNNEDVTQKSRNTGLEVGKKKFNKMKNEVIIDDDEEIILEDTIKAGNKERKGSDDTARASSSKQTSKCKKLKKDEESDEEVELQSSGKILRKKISVVETDKLKRKARARERDSENREKGIDRVTDVTVKGSTGMDVILVTKKEIVTDDESDCEDIVVQNNVDRVTKKRGRSDDIVSPKRMRRDEASTSKQNLEVDDAGELSEDGSEESIDVIEYRSKKKTVKTPVIDLDKLDRKNIRRDAGDETSKPKGAKKRMRRIEVIEEEESDADIESLRENEITVITDDEDTDDIKFEPSITKRPEPRRKKETKEEKCSTKEETKEKTSREEVKKTKASSSKKKLGNEYGESSSAQEPKKEKTKKKTLSKEAKTTEASTSKKELKNKEEEISFAQEPKKTEQTRKYKDENSKVEWSECNYLCEFNQINPQIAENLLTLFKNDNTIPFIARYRKEMTGGLEPEKLRSIKNSYDNMKSVKSKALVILQKIDKLGKWSPEIYSDVMSAKTTDDLEAIYAPFKSGAVSTLAERAKELGLAPVCDDILQGRSIPSLHAFVDPGKEGLRDLAEVRQAIIHIIAHVMSKDKSTAEAIAELRKSIAMTITTKARNTSGSSKTGLKDKPNENDVQKYENYFNWKCPETSIRDHQILAINRGEEQKILSVGVVIPEQFVQELKTRCLDKYRFIRDVSQYRWDILKNSFDDAYARLMKPQIIRQVRHRLTEKAENASIAVFANNLKNLLLTPPLRGKTVLGIDPGFKHGCKLAVVSPCGDILDTATIFPKFGSESHQKGKKELPAARTLTGLVKKHRCTVVGLGNATACRETEQFLNDLIQEGAFAPIDLAYTIIDESGASIYSCSKEAKSEFPNLDPNLISAVSLARRLQDPLAELIKVDPKHLGVGMYQHDLPQKQLQFTLNEVISEIVSFVGVDVNTASQCLLKKVAGLSETRAANIIKHRTNCGPFTNRQQLLEVFGIGPKCFEQCAGFVRISPETASINGALSPTKKYPLDYLDQTWIHPESYNIARQFLKACRCSLEELGSDRFIEKVSSYGKRRGRRILAEEYGTSETTMDIIINGLSMKKGEDIRCNKDAPLFKKNLRCMADLEVNTVLTGSVRNVTHFGAFTDIGIGVNGLIHISEMRGRVLSIGQKVKVSVLNVDKAKKRVSLSLITN